MSEHSLISAIVSVVQHQESLSTQRTQRSRGDNASSRKRAPSMSTEERRQAIIDAVGPAVVDAHMQLSTKELAQLAGVAEGTLFRVFKDKQDLMLQAAHHELERRIDDDAWTRPLTQTSDDASAQQRITQWIDAMVTMFEVWPSVMTIMRQSLDETKRGNTSDRGQAERWHMHHLFMKNLYKRFIARIDSELQAYLTPIADQLIVPVDDAAQFIHYVVLSHTMAILREEERRLDTATVARIIIHGICK